MATSFGPQSPNWLLHPTYWIGRPRPQPAVDELPPPVNIFVNAIYYPNWAIYRHHRPASLNLDVISHVFYAFAWIKPDGIIYLSDEWADTQTEVDGTHGCLNAFVKLKRKHSILKVILSVGGVGRGSESFAAVAGDPASRARFAQSARDIVLNYGLDGIDVNWCPSNQQQGKDYVKLLALVRTYLPIPRFTLTSALPTNQSALKHINLCEAARYVDFINVMAYDFAGPWSQTCEHHAQLFTPVAPHNAEACSSCHSIITEICSQGVSAGKILLGIPTYGRSFLGANGVGQTFSGYAGDEGSFEYKDLPRPGTKELVDGNVAAAYCVGHDCGWVTYDNPQTVRMKAQYARQNGLAGLFYWTGTGDSKDPYRSLVYNGYIALHSETST